MSKATDQRREKLRETLADIAERHVRDGGLSSLRARALAEEAGCAVGAIYNVFDDMTGLALAVNSRTFHRLGTFVSDAVARRGGTDPTDRMVAMAMAYLQFATDNPLLWRALFDVEFAADRDVPEWYMEELSRLFAIIAEPLSELKPEADAEDIHLMTRALFSSVHGIVLLGLDGRVSIVPRDKIEDMIGFVLRGAAGN
ncbi:MAG: TetR/AcrR family transcriptional regulator [Pseudomonadota bacterium]